FARVPARLTRRVASAPGREDYVQARLETRDGELWAEPVFGKSNLIFTMVKADGMIHVPLDRSGIEAGDLAGGRLFCWLTRGASTWRTWGWRMLGPVMPRPSAKRALGRGRPRRCRSLRRWVVSPPNRCGRASPRRTTMPRPWMASPSAPPTP